MAEMAAIIGIAFTLVSAIVTVTAFIVTMKIDIRGLAKKVEDIGCKLDTTVNRTYENEREISNVGKDIQFIKETLVEIKDRLIGEGR
jgi:hypothetical protein